MDAARDLRGGSYLRLPTVPGLIVLVQVVTVLALVLLLILWSLAFWKRPRLAFGVLIGLLVAWLGSLFIGAIRLEEIPVWLPPLPFATVALCLFVFGFLAWYWGRDESDQSGEPPAKTTHESAHDA
jgi:hypothetical protein